MAESPVVFVSYAHENEEHGEKVLALADQLTRNGLDVRLDQYDPHPNVSWTTWMETNLREADYVLLVCSPAYIRRVEQRDAAGKGLGVRWEGNLIYSRLYENLAQADKYIPILLPGFAVEDIPLPVRNFTRYKIEIANLDDAGYAGLYRHLTKQPEIVKPEIGPIQSLPPKSRP